MEQKELKSLTSDILQSFSTQNIIKSIEGIVMAKKKQKNRSVEQDRKPRDKPLSLQSPNIWQRRQENTMEKGQTSQ